MTEFDRLRQLALARQRIARAQMPNIGAVSSGSPAAPAPEERRTGVVSDVVQSLVSGAMQGAGSLLDLPNNLIDLAGRGVVTAAETGAGLLGYENPEAFQRARDYWGVGSSIGSARAGIDRLSGGFSERQPQTTPGEYAHTVGQFLPGAALGGVSGLLRYGVVPGLASEAAGQATEGVSVAGVPVEPIARLGAGLLAPSLAGRVASPFGGADPLRVQMADDLTRAGVPVTAGQRVHSDTLRRMEGAVSPSEPQLEAFTGAVLRSVGASGSRATPDALRAAETRIVGEMDRAIQGLSVTMTPSIAQRAASVADDYLQFAPAGSVVPRIRAVVDDIVEAATSPTNQTISLDRMRSWRSALGRMTQSADEATRTAAVELRSLIDDATDSALIAANRTEDIQRLASAREQYRNLLAVQDAASRAGAEAGILSPAALEQAVIRTQGRASYAMGRGTPLADLSRAGAATLRPMPTVEAGGARTIPQLTRSGLLGGGAALGYQLGDVPGAIAGGLLGASVQPAAQALVGTGPIQAYLRNQGVGPALSIGDPRRVGGLLSSISAQ